MSRRLFPYPRLELFKQLKVTDDPGPDAELVDEEEPERQGEGWRRLRGLFW